MARPIKSGIDYFSLDVHMDEKIELIEAKYGLEGFGFIIKLFQKIYSNSYFYEINEDIVLLMKKNLCLSTELIYGMINDAVKWEIFNTEKFKEYSILTSKGIQKRYINITKSRKEVLFIKEYLLVEINAKSYPKRVNVIINSVNVIINSIKPQIKTQSKVKYSKVNKSKEKESKKNFLSDSKEIRLATLLFTEIQKNNKGFIKPNLQKWATHIDSMIRLDNRKIKEIKKVIYICQQDSFWFKNILSTKKLRKQFDKLYLLLPENGKSEKDQKENLLKDEFPRLTKKFKILYSKRILNQNYNKVKFSNQDESNFIQAAKKLNEWIENESKDILFDQEEKENFTKIVIYVFRCIESKSKLSSITSNYFIQDFVYDQNLRSYFADQNMIK